MKRRIALFLAALLCAVAFAGVADETIQIGALKGATAMGMAWMMADDHPDYEFFVTPAIDEITAGIARGRPELAAVPANLAAVLHNNTGGGLYVLAINTLGVLYIVERGEDIRRVEDLRGRTIYATGKGAIPEYALLYILAENGLDPDRDVAIEWKAEPAECVAALLAHDDAIAMLPQPFVSTAQMQRDDIRMALDLTAEWDALQEGSEHPSALITGVVVGNRAFVDANPGAVAQFLDAYKDSVAYVNANTAEAAQLIERFDIVKADVAERALPYCNIVFIEGEEMARKLSGYLAVLMEQNPKAIGGALPDDAFYYAR